MFMADTSPLAVLIIKPILFCAFFDFAHCK